MFPESRLCILLYRCYSSVYKPCFLGMEIESGPLVQCHYLDALVDALMVFSLDGRYLYREWTYPWF